MITTRTRRLDPGVFDLPVEKMRAGWYTDAYFNHTRATLLEDGRHPQVVMQVFQKKNAYLGGMDEAIAVLKLCAEGFDRLTVHALYDGDELEPYEAVMTIEGDYTTFAHLETVYLGVLARRTLITTNTVNVLRAANGKPVIFMPAGIDDDRVQTGDGDAAYVAGQVVGAEISASRPTSRPPGGAAVGRTVPHAADRFLRADTALAANEVRRAGVLDMRITVLVDFETTGANRARRRRGARSEAVGRQARHVRVARRPVALGRGSATSHPRA